MPPAVLYGLIGYCVKEPDNVNTIALEDVSASITLRGFVAHIKSSLRYRNATALPLQVTFKTPVDEGSALYHVEAKLEDRVIVAKCLEKNKAEKVYKDAVEAGQTAVLVREESETADIINLALGNLPAGAECEVTLSLVAELRVGSDGGVQFTLPTVLNPRYQPASSTGPDAPVVSHVTPVATASKPYSIQVAASVCGALDIARIISHSDPINVVMEDDNKSAKISQDGGYRSDHEWSFVVHYNNPYSPQVLIETGDPTATGLMKDQVLMLNLFPELPGSSYSRFNEVIFVIDRSGSMNGEKIQSARAVLMLFLKSLPPGCRFNVVCFGSSHFFLFQEGSRVYSEETLAEACALHDKMDADMGGTEILQPLKAIYSQPVDPEFSRQVLMLTDGEVWNVDEVMELAARYASSTRVFTVGIGEGASTALVKGLARAGRGRAELVTQRDRMSTKVMGLVTSMLQSSVRGVNVSCELDPPSRLSLVPPEPPVIFAGQHLVTFARMPPGTQLKGVTLTGQVDGEEWRSSVAGAHLRTVHDANFALHRLAARASILHLCLHEGDDAKEEIVRLSVAASVLSPHTGFVAVDQDSKCTLPPLMRPCYIPTHPLPFTRPYCNFGAHLRSSSPGLGMPFGFGRSSNAQQNTSGSLFGVQSRPSASFASSKGFGSQVGAQSSLFGSSVSVHSQPFVQKNVSFSSTAFGAQPNAPQNTFGFCSFGSQSSSQQNTFGTPTFGAQPSAQQNTFGSHTFGAQLDTSGSPTFGSQTSTQQNTFRTSRNDGPQLEMQSIPFGSAQATSSTPDFTDLSKKFKFGVQSTAQVAPSGTVSAADESPPEASSFQFGLPTTEHQGETKSSFRFRSETSNAKCSPESAFSSGSNSTERQNSHGSSFQVQLKPSENERANESSFCFSAQSTEPEFFSPSSAIFGFKTSPQPTTPSSSLFGCGSSACPAPGLHEAVPGVAPSFLSDTNTASSAPCGVSSGAFATAVQSACNSQEQDAMLRIIKFQNFDGSWSIEDIFALSMVDEKEASVLRQQEGDSAALATAIAVVVLQERFSDMAGEWTLVVKKARNFLAGKVGEKNVEELLEKIRSQLRAMKSAAICPQK